MYYLRGDREFREIASCTLPLGDGEPKNVVGELTNIWYPCERAPIPWTDLEAVELRKKMKWRRPISTDGFQQACLTNKLQYIPTLDWVVGVDRCPYTILYLTTNLSVVTVQDFKRLYYLNRAMYAYKRRYKRERENHLNTIFPPRRLFKYCESIMPENCECEKISIFSLKIRILFSHFALRICNFPL